MQEVTDKKLEIVISNLLRTGVALSGVVVLGAGVVFLNRHGHEIANYSTFHGQPTELRELKGIWGGVLDGRSRAVIQFGILLLIATPVFRVFTSLVGFLLERDYLYVVFTIIVLLALLYSVSGV